MFYTTFSTLLSSPLFNPILEKAVVILRIDNFPNFLLYILISLYLFCRL